MGVIEWVPSFIDYPLQTHIQPQVGNNCPETSHMWVANRIALLLT